MSCCGKKRSELIAPQAAPAAPQGARPPLKAQLRAFMARKAMTVTGQRVSRTRSTGRN